MKVLYITLSIIICLLIYFVFSKTHNREDDRLEHFFIEKDISKKYFS